MVFANANPAQRRLAAAAAVIGLHIGGLALLLRPILPPQPPQPESLILVDVPPPPQPEPDPPPPTPEPAARSAPPAPRARPRPVAAPTPPQPAPSPVATAPATGTRTASGAAAQGPGTGAAGMGFGAGAGASGQGQGAGTRPRWKSGSITRRDYPASASRGGATGAVTAHFDVGTDGRVSGCIVVRSSGNAALDSTTCRLLEQRFRYEPARDASGQPVPGVAGWRQDWWLEPPR